MYSISSQIFNGLTEYVTSYSHKSSQDLERQDGPVGSGRILADIISNQSSTEERKFLHDYSYNLFEEKLIEDKRVLQINLNNIGEEISKIENYDFIKVQGRLLFSDIRIMNDTIENFNKIGEALFFISNFHDLEKLKSQYDQTLTKQQNKINKGFAQTSNHQKSDIETLAYKAGLQFDKVFLEKLSFILKYGYRDQFEIKSYLSTIAANYLFSAVLKREYLREDEDLIVKKYSRYSEKEFVVFGTVTQSNDHQDDLPPEANADDMKEVISQLVLKLSDVEKQFIGKRKNEIIIDPIAVYREF
jgi:hypothetical protein